MLPYLLMFCRIVIGVTFAYSFLTKVRDVNGFARTITNFKLLPGRLSRPAAILFLFGELVVVFLITGGGRLLPIGFGLAILLLLLFTTALTWTLTRNIQTPCHCFGVDKQPVTIYDLWRNTGFILCAAGGWGISYFGDVAALTWVEWSIVVLPALVIVMLMAHLGEIIAISRTVWRK